MARAGMANVILAVRQRANIGTSDYTVAGTSYFTDDQIQAVLDRYQTVYKNFPIEAQPEYVNGANSYTEYDFGQIRGEIEQSITVRDSAGAAVSASDYEVNYQAKRITFDADTGGDAHYLTCNEYDLERTLAQVWEQKAGFEHESIDFKGDNQDIKASQRYQHCLEQAKHWKRQARPISVKMVRMDEAY